MNQYQEMLDKGIIEFDKLIIETYYLLDINEVDVVILIKLNDLFKKGKNSLSINEIIKTMKISVEDFSNRVVNLANRGFIAFELDEKGNEVFSLTGIYSKLSMILDKDKETEEVKKIDSEMFAIINTIEKESRKILSPIELEIISKWFYEYNYSQEIINKMIFEAVKNKKSNVRYIDKLLAKQEPKEKNTETTSNSNIQDLFNKIYDK